MNQTDNHRPITDYDRNYIKENYLIKTDVEMSRYLKRGDTSASSIRTKMKLYRIRQPHYTTEEVKFIKESFKVLTDKEIAKQLNRPVGSIQSKRHQLKSYRERRMTTRAINCKVEKMQRLIAICEAPNTLFEMIENPYKIIQAREQLKKLSGL